MSTTTPAKVGGFRQTISATTPRTPIRAISSKISSKSTPLLPSPTEVYEPHVKTVFRHRLQTSLSLSAAYTSAIVNAWTFWQAGGIAKVGLWGVVWLLINPRNICTNIMAWTIMAVPVTVLRKMFLTCTYIIWSNFDRLALSFLSASRSAMSSPWSTVKSAFSQKSTSIAIVVHLTSSIYVLALHVFNEYAYSSDDPKLGMFVKSRYVPHLSILQ